MGNDQCEMCTGNNQFSNSERTACICDKKFIGVNCDSEYIIGLLGISISDMCSTYGALTHRPSAKSTFPFEAEV